MRPGPDPDQTLEWNIVHHRLTLAELQEVEDAITEFERSESAVWLAQSSMSGEEPIFALAAFDHGRDSDGFRKPCCCEDWDGEE